MRPKVTAGIILTVSFILTAVVARPETRFVYAAPDGGGTLCTQDAPCSLAGARDRVRSLNRDMSGDIIVWLRGGTYALTETFTLDSRDSGTNGYMVSYRAYDGESPVISGGRRISGWTRALGTPLWQADAGTAVYFRQLYVNGIRATRAGMGSGELGSVAIPGIGQSSVGFTTFGYTPPQSWTNPSDVEFVFTGGGVSVWSEPRCGVSSIIGDGSSTHFVIKEPCWSNVTVRKQLQTVTYPTRIENAYELLDSPGEWYLDRTSRIVSYLPRDGEDMTNATVVAPILETLVLVQGSPGDPVQNIEFRGLTFAYATWLQPNGNEGYAEIQAGWMRVGEGKGVMAPGNVVFHRARNIHLGGNTFCHLGAQGVVFDQGTRDNVMYGNVFTDISGTAVRIGNIDAPRADEPDQDRGNIVSNNYIHDVAVEYRGGIGLMGAYVADTIFTHNEIANLPYTAVSLGWGWGSRSYAQNNVISYNNVHHYMRVLSDGGGLYILSDQAASDGSGRSLVYGNYFHDQVNDFGAFYCDDGTGYVDLYDNVFASVPRWLFIWNPSIHDVTVRDNYSDTYAYRNLGTNTTMTGNQQGLASWPPAALAIIDRAGLEWDKRIVSDPRFDAAARVDR